MSSNSYGTVPSAQSSNGAAQHASEEGPLLGKPPDSKAPFASRLRKRMNENISRDWADSLLLAGYVITGLLDSASISIYGAFVSMQTGNTVYFGLGVSSPYSSTKWLKSLISIVAFCAGSTIFAAFHRHFSPRRRLTLLTSYLFQLALIVAAALIVQIGPDLPIDDHHLDWTVAVPLAALAFQSAGQAVTSRVLQYGGLTSVVLTSNYCDLFGDPNLLAGLSANIERNRRVAAPILLVIGAIAGGFLAKSSLGLAAALWVACAIKAGICVAWVLWKMEEVE